MPGRRDGGSPAVSVVVPLYESAATLSGFLDALRRQSFTAFEVLLVDSSPTDACEQLVRRSFPEVAYQRRPERLLPHAARNLGAGEARGELLVFTDPDVYPAPDWLERLVAAHRERGGVVVGALDCYGSRWLDRGIHLTKFSKWLPAGRPRRVDVSPTANMICATELFRGAGGFKGDMMMADATLSWALRRRGETLWLEPRAVVAHHHLDKLGDFLGERWRRGARFARARLEWLGGGRPTALYYLTVTVLPLRLASNLARTMGHGWRAGWLAATLLTLPVVLLGHAASLAGEARAYAEHLATRPPPAAARASRSR